MIPGLRPAQLGTDTACRIRTTGLQNNGPEYRQLQQQFMEFLREEARRSPVAMNPMCTGFYNAFIR